MKKVQHCLLVLMIFVIVAFGAQTVMASETGTTNDFQWEYENGIMRITGYDYDYEDEVTTLNIPSSVNGHTVTCIDEGAFAYCFEDINENVTVKIPNTVTEIESGAFEGCCGIKSINIPGSIKTIKHYTFKDCSGLTSIVIPNSVTVIDDSAFEGCSGLTSIVIPNSVTEIRKDAFKCCTGLKKITFSNQIKFLPSGMFWGCTGLTSIDIPKTVESITNQVFYNCTGIKSVTIPNTVTFVADDAFGLYSNASGQETKVPGFTVNGYYGTYAEYIATTNGFKFNATQSNIADIADIYNFYKNGIYYTGKPIIPDFKIRYKLWGHYGYPFGKETDLVEGKDYTFTVTNNLNAGEACLTVTGINHYKGTITEPFTIKPDCPQFFVDYDTETFDYTKSGVKPTVQIDTAKGDSANGMLTLVEGVDYTLSFSVDEEAGTQTMTVTGINNYCGGRIITLSQNDLTDDSPSDSTSDSPSDSTSDSPSNSTSGDTPAPSPAPSPAPAPAPVAAPAATVQEPITVTQVPSKVKAKAKKNKVTVFLKKFKKNKKSKALLKQITGIQIQYSTDPGFTQNVSTKNVGKKKTKVTLKLQKKTTYYIRVRYVGNGGYSNWSGVKKVKTK